MRRHFVWAIGGLLVASLTLAPLPAGGPLHAAESLGPQARAQQPSDPADSTPPRDAAASDRKPQRDTSPGPEAAHSGRRRPRPDFPRGLARPRPGGQWRAGDRFGPARPPFGPPGPRPEPGPDGPPWLDEPVEDPEMVALNETDLRLARQSLRLAAEYRRAGSEQKKDQLQQQLNELVHEHFQVRQKRRELQLKRLEEQLQQLREAVKQRAELKQQIIDRRVAELTGKRDPLDF